MHAERERASSEGGGLVSEKRSRARQAGAAIVLIALGLQTAMAAVAFTQERPAPYAWQMYSAVPYSPRAWAVTDGGRERIDVEGLMVYARAEIDRVELLRTVGCERLEADAILIELADDTTDEVVCR